MCQNDIEVCGYGNVPQTSTTGRHSKHRPGRHKVQIRDQREHRKRDLYLAWAEEDWGYVIVPLMLTKQ